MSVSEYVAKFEELARYSSEGKYAPDESWKIDQFRWGLRPDIRGSLAHTTFTDFATLAHQSYVAEEAISDITADRREKWQKGKGSGQASKELKVRGSLGKGKAPA